ncbi:RhuM family protein [Ekhidna sp.]|uniref:RhuM family protein n=1 Tax=Ekhidna sp. TaxID=2608089 RepID=UPI003CCBDC76
MNRDQDVQIFETEQGIEVRVILEDETVWATQREISQLFDTTPQNITQHLKNAYDLGEIEEKATCKKSLQVRKEGNRNVRREQLVYNLDAILSVGYRINTKKGTLFRIWASQKLKDYLVKGYALNEKRLSEKQEQLDELKKIVQLQGKVLDQYQLESTEAEGLVKVITSYTRALDLLDDYDHQRLQIPKSVPGEVVMISYQEAKRAIQKLGEETNFKGLFGIEKDQSFKSSLKTIYQTFDGDELYPTIQEKAAHLLYFVVKNHSFTDGNKRIAAFLFVWFLDKNGILYASEGRRALSNDALVALTLMIAESHPEDKDMMIKVIVNLLLPKK